MNRRRIIPYNPKLKELARQLRNNSTVTEKLKKGLKTPQDAYRIPILQALAETKGGLASCNDVLKQVKELMKGRLNDYDQERPSSKSQYVRWVNTAHWERRKMVIEGLLQEVKDSSKGTWKITEEGRRFLMKL